MRFPILLLLCKRDLILWTLSASTTNYTTFTKKRGGEPRIFIRFYSKMEAKSRYPFYLQNNVRVFRSGQSNSSGKGTKPSTKEPGFSSGLVPV